MTPRTAKQQQWNLASVDLRDGFTDFWLSRQAMNCTPATMAFYKQTAGAFLSWVEGQGIASPHEVAARHVRQYLARLADKADTTRHAHARAIRTLLRFWHAEGYIPQLVKFEMPKLARKRLLVLTIEQLRQIVKACNVRDKAIVLLMVDSGLRRGEVSALNWGDVEFSNGLVRVRQGKGRKDRSAVIGATTRRALLAYRRTISNRLENSPLFQTNTGGRFMGNGLMMLFRRLSKRTGIHITAHSLRRTFVILSLRNGMDVLHLQAMLGHASLEMTRHYAQMIDDDLIQAHDRAGVVDRNFF